MCRFFHRHPARAKLFEELDVSERSAYKPGTRIFVSKDTAADSDQTAAMLAACRQLVGAGQCDGRGVRTVLREWVVASVTDGGEGEERRTQDAGPNVEGEGEGTELRTQNSEVGKQGVSMEQDSGRTPNVEVGEENAER